MKNVTSKDVALLAGVSRTTVSLILNNAANTRISEETRQKVLNAAKELKYYPNVLAQSLITKRSKIIGLVIPSITNPFFSSIAQGVEDAAVENDYNIFLCNSFRSTAKEKVYINTLAGKQVDGIIFASTTYNSDIIQELRQRGIPIIAFDRKISDFNVDTVLFDNEKGGEMAVEYLVSLGHRHIAFLSGPINISSRSDRFEGYKKALSKAGLPVNPDYIIHDDLSEKESLDASYEIDTGFKMANDILSRAPEITAIFAVNDMTAIGVLKAIKTKGLKVPQDISLIGFDDIFLTRAIDPLLTTIAQPKYKMGKAAVELLLSRLNEKKSSGSRNLLIFQPELVIRESCQAIKR